MAITVEGRMTKLRGESNRGRRGHLYALLAVVTCPCHLPILAILLSGSAVGAFLSDYFIMTLTIFSLLFIFSLTAAIRALRVKQAHDV